MSLFHFQSNVTSLLLNPLEKNLEGRAGFSKSTDEVYAKIRVKLESSGLPIGHHDLLIAAHALSLGLTVVPAKECEFSRIENLTVENWNRL